MPSLVNPVFVVGLPGVADIGRMASSFLIDFVNGKLFAEYYSQFFPDYVIVNDGVCRLPRVEFYESADSAPNLILLKGDGEIAFDEPQAYYCVCDDIVRFALKLKAEKIFVLGGVRAEGEDVIYATATTPALTRNLEKEGAKILRKVELLGMDGLILGLSKLRGLEASGIFGATSALTPDRDAALSIFKFVIKTLNLKRIRAGSG
jgi:proteasome assembly chaperone (PAC2) family protein